jgi:hypothetical protein
MESKRATNTEQAKRLNPHLTGSTGIENKRGRKNGIRTLSTNSSWNRRRLKKKRHDPTIQTLS